MIMPLFRRKPDSISLTMALVQAYAADNRSMIEEVRQELAPVPTLEILRGLYQFGQILNKANLRPEQTAAIKEELEATTGDPDMMTAVQHVGQAILIERSHSALVEAVNKYAPPLLNSTSDQFRQMVLTLAAITGSVCRRLEVTFSGG
jgi:hypothetical protein